MPDVLTQFGAAIRAAGLIPPDVIEPGHFYRFNGQGKHNGNTAGWCKLFPDGIGGIYGDYSTGLSSDWHAHRETPFTPAEREAFRRHVAEARAQAEAERDTKRAEAASKAAAIWKAAQPAAEDHAYLTRKGIKASGARLHNGALVIPMRDGNDLHSLQFIAPDGDKRFLTGGRVTGCYHCIGKVVNGALCIAEGFATGASIHEATGCAVAVTFNAGNLEAVAKALREKFPDLRLLVVCADDDFRTVNNPGLTKATAAARAVGALLAIPNFGADRPEDATDFNDLHRLRGLEAVERAIRDAKPPAISQAQPSEKNATAAESEGLKPDNEVIERLSALSPLEYDRVRRAEAEALGVRPGTLDKMVQAPRKRDGEDGIDFPDVQPWPTPIDPASLLTEISATVRRFIVCQQETADAVTLWASMTWFMDVVQIAPLAIITAPEKRCGKTLLLSLIGKLAHRPLTASNISAPAMFRAVDAWHPTLLVDEADSFVRDNEALRGIVNAGHTRDSAYVVRVVGDDFTPKKFSVWGAKALAAIGQLADTLMDRAVVLELRRKLSHEQAERLRYAEADLFEVLAKKLARFAEDYREAVRQARPELPASLNDRAQDNWEPLLAIADVAGGSWPELGRKAATKLCDVDSSTMTVGTELLADIKRVFALKKTDRISTANLIEALCSDDERPWATYNHGKPITPRQVARKLSEYGITSFTIRIGPTTAKGFLRDRFDETFARYLAVSPATSVTPPQASIGVASRVTAHSPRYGNNSAGVTPKPAPDSDCGGVTDRTGQPRHILLKGPDGRIRFCK